MPRKEVIGVGARLGARLATENPPPPVPPPPRVAPQPRPRAVRQRATAIHEVPPAPHFSLERTHRDSGETESAPPVADLPAPRSLMAPSVVAAIAFSLTTMLVLVWFGTTCRDEFSWEGLAQTIKKWTDERQPPTDDLPYITSNPLVPQPSRGQPAEQIVLGESRDEEPTPKARF